MTATARTTPSPDPVIVLLAHMACADGQLHQGELDAIRLVLTRLGAPTETEAACNEVFNGQVDRVARRTLAAAVPVEQRTFALELLVTVAYADGICFDSEREMLEEIATRWEVTKKHLDALCESAQAAGERARETDDDVSTASLGARLLSMTDRVFSPRVVDRIASVSESARERVDRLRREFLLAGPGYREAVAKCARIAEEDYSFAREKIAATRTQLMQLLPSLDAAVLAVGARAGHRTGTTAQTLKTLFESTRTELAREVDTRLAQVERSTLAKQRALKSFTVTFMGRTKAGKSTLHAVVTGQGWEGIGIGAQRTTRMNRVYEWRHIRIIDTPGIGAPGGLSDEEIAAQVIAESDVISYVVTNDSQQEAEFRFLKVLKEHSKPLIILLNVKENLRDPERLRRFLRRPDRPFRSDGPSGLDGHVERIRRYAREHYANDYFSIVPVHLLAAQMSREEAHREIATELMQASRLPDFLDGIRASLIDMGPLRRSQTLLAGTVTELRRSLEWTREQGDAFKRSYLTIEHKTRAMLPTLQNARENALRRLDTEIRTVFAAIQQKVNAFAEDHWADPADALNLAWERELATLQVERQLASAYDSCVREYGDHIRDALDELGRDLELNARLKIGFSRMDAQASSTFWKNLFRWGGQLLSLTGIVLGFVAAVAAPVAAGVAVLGGLLSLASQLFDNREKKRGRAVAEISRVLRDEILAQEKRNLAAARDAIEKHANATGREIRAYFDGLTGGLDAMATTFSNAHDNLSAQVGHLERAYAKRVLDWMTGIEEPLTPATIARAVDTAVFEPGRILSIRARSPVLLRRPMAQLKAALQHDVDIQPLA